MALKSIERSTLSRTSAADVIHGEAAKLAGVADTLREIAEHSGECGNIVPMLADVLDAVNSKISDVASQLERGRGHG